MSSTAQRRHTATTSPTPNLTRRRRGSDRYIATAAAASAVMVAVFFTFALSGPLPPKEMGIVLGVTVLLVASLVRLVLLPVLLRLTGKAAW